MLWAAGDTIVHQEVWHGRVWAARPLVVVEDTPERMLLWMPHGTRRKVPMTPPERPDPQTLDERLIELLSRGDWIHVDHLWDVSTLWILHKDDWHSTWVSWLPDGSHYGWYVNLQQPFRRTDLGIEAMDLMLDVVVDPDLTWRWKDDRQFDDMVARGVIDADIAVTVREAARRVIRRIELAEEPFTRRWTRWRPDPMWSVPVLPEGWDVAR